MKLQLTIITLALISVALPFANAQTDEIDVGFIWDDKDCIESHVVTTEGTFKKLDCSWLQAITPITEDDQPEMDEPDAPLSTPMPGEDQGIPTVIKETPQTPAEREIEKLTKKLEKNGELPSHEDQLLMALLSLQKECEIGTEEGAPIQNYELFTIATFEPYTHTDLGTQYLLNQIERAIQTCKAQDTMKHKILGAQYLNMPGKDDVKAPHVFRSDFEGLIWDELEGLDNPTYAHQEKHMTGFNFDKSTQFAETYQCSLAGIARGLCVGGASDPITPKPTISSEGKAMLDAKDKYLETGEAILKEHMKQLETPEEYAIQQYMRAYGLTSDDLRALADKIESQQ